LANVNVPTATVAVNNCLYTGVDLNRDGIPDALEAGMQPMGGFGVTVPRRPSVRRREQAAMSPMYPPQQLLPAGPARLGALNRSNSGTSSQTLAIEQIVGTTMPATVPATVISPRGPFESSSPSLASAAGYGLRLHTAAAADMTYQSARSSSAPRAPLTSGVMRSPTPGLAPISPRPAVIVAPASPQPGSMFATTSPRQCSYAVEAAFSEVCPPHPPLGTTRPAMPTTVGAVGGIVLEVPAGGRRATSRGPPTSLPGSMQSVHRSVSPVPSQDPL